MQLSNRVIAGLVAAFILLIAIFSSVFVVNAREQVIVTRLGAIDRIRTEPGLYFKLPFVETLQRIEDRMLRLDLDNQLVQVADGKRYVVDAFLTYRIEEADRFRRIAQNQERAENLIGARFDAALRQVYGQRGFEAALSEERSVMMQEVAERLRPAAENLGIDIKDVRIRRTDLTQDVSAQTYERMKAERFAEAENLRARGNEAARRIEATANRQVVEIRAAAQREAEILRGEGEAERNRIFAEAFSQDPGFFEFYRSMSAYRRALENSGTTMVLSPDSEFFQYFQNPGASIVGANPAVAVRRSGAPLATDADAAAGTPATPAATPAIETPPTTVAPAAPADTTLDGTTTQTDADVTIVPIQPAPATGADQ